MKTTAAPALVLSIVCLSACVDLTKPPEVWQACEGSNPTGCLNGSKADTGVTRKDGSVTEQDTPTAIPDTAAPAIDSTLPLPQDTGTKDTPPAIPDLAPDQPGLKLDTAPLVEPPLVEPRPEPTVEPPIVVVEPSATDAAPAADTKLTVDTLVPLDSNPPDTRISPDTTTTNCMEAIKTNGYAFPPASPCSACKENSEPRETACMAMIDCVAKSYPCTGNCWTDCRNKAGASSVSESCATALKTAACGSH